MQTMQSVDELAESVSQWCEKHGVLPANGQAAERITARNVRYYRTLGLVDPPLSGGGQGYAEKHRLQLMAIKILQGKGLPLRRIQELLFGRTSEELKRIERDGLAELAVMPAAAFRGAGDETWAAMALDDDYLLISRRGRNVPPEVRQQLLSVLNLEMNQNRRLRGLEKGE